MLITLLIHALIGAPVPTPAISYVAHYNEYQKAMYTLAQERGLSVQDAADLLLDLSADFCLPVVLDSVRRWQGKGFDLASYLAAVVQKCNLPLDPPHEMAPMYASKILFWIGLCRTPEATRLLLDQCRMAAKEPIINARDTGQLGRILRALGYTRSESALSLLMKIARGDAFKEESDFRITISIANPEERAKTLERIQRIALSDIADSGTDAALHLFSPGVEIGVPFAVSEKDRDKLFRLAAYTRVEVMISPREGVLITEEQELQLKKLYKQYGKEYVPLPKPRSSPPEGYVPPKVRKSPKAD